MFDRFVYTSASFDHPVTGAIVVAVAAILAISGIAIFALRSRVPPAMRTELRLRWLSWCVLAPAFIIPVLLGPGAAIIMIAMLSLGSFAEFARATGLFRHRMLSAGVALGIVLISLAALDNWYLFQTALVALICGLLAVVGLFPDQPKGYLQRVALAVFGFALFGVCLGHFSALANSANYRPALLLLVAMTQCNDVFAFCSGKLLGRPGTSLGRKLAPNTSPGKTLAGSLGAVLITTPLTALVAHYVFEGMYIDTPGRLIGLGLIVSILGQLGDLIVSSIKRDVGIKDMSALIPGHGGILDRANSLLLVAPAGFHYLRYLGAIEDAPPYRLFF